MSLYQNTYISSSKKKPHTHKLLNKTDIPNETKIGNENSLHIRNLYCNSWTKLMAAAAIHTGKHMKYIVLIYAYYS